MSDELIDACDDENNKLAYKKLDPLTEILGLMK